MSISVVSAEGIARSKQNRILFVFFPIYAFLCGFVFVEPSPAEAFFLISALFLLIYSRFVGEQMLLSLLFVISTLVSLGNGVANGSLNERYFIIDIYLFMLFFIFSSVKISRETFRYLFHVTIIGFTVASTVNILFYFYAILTGSTVFFGSQVVAFGIRFKGFFKDPNVLGPFMTVPSMYWLDKFLSESQSRKSTLFIGLLMTLGVFLSFSRGAWLNYFAVLSLVILSSLKFKWSWLRVLLLMVLFLLLIYSVTGADISVLGYDLTFFFNQRLRLQSYDADRFASQQSFIEMLRENPLFGIGPGNYEVYTNYAAHSLFARLFGERGLIGFLIFITVFLLGMKKAYEKHKFLSYLLLGILLNSIFVDTFHWRHFWLLLAFSFMRIEQDPITRDCQRTLRVKSFRTSPKTDCR